MADFFIGGSHRSGTTLMQAVLAADKTANPVMGESTNFSALVDAYVHGKYQFEKSVGDFFPDPDALREFYADTARRYLEVVRERTGAQHLVLKDPNLTPRLAEVHDLLPEARFVVITRHPFDVIASMIRVGKRLQEMGEWCPFDHRDVGKMCIQYLGCYGPLAEAQEKSKSFQQALFWVRYEDLVTDADSVLEGIGKFTGLDCRKFDLSGEWRMFSSLALAANKRQEAFPTKLSGRGLSKDSIGKFQDVLSTDDCQLIKKECREAITAFGYDRNP